MRAIILYVERVLGVLVAPKGAVLKVTPKTFKTFKTFQLIILDIHLERARQHGGRDVDQ